MKYLLATISILLLIIIIAGGAFYFGQQSANQSKEMTTTPSPSPFVTAQTPTPELIQEENLKTIKAGGVLSLSSYSIAIPLDWTSQRQQGDGFDELTITKQGYKIKIYQAAFGGGGCIYVGEPEAFYTKYNTFVEIQNPNGFVFRRGQNESTGTTSWTVCQKDTDGNYGTITSFGAITINNSATIDETIMSEADQILASLKKS